MKTKAEIVQRLLKEEVISTEEAVVLLKEKYYEINPNITQAPYIPIIGETDELVPFGSICSCNPANGGSGICGCIMGNKMVPNNKETGTFQKTTNNFNCKNEACFCDGSCTK